MELWCNWCARWSEKPQDWFRLPGVPPYTRLAQLVEQVPYKHQVKSSSLLPSTSLFGAVAQRESSCFASRRFLWVQIPPAPPDIRAISEVVITTVCLTVITGSNPVSLAIVYSAD